MIGEPRVVAAGRGAAWWGGGVRIFMTRIGTWIGIMIIYFIISALISAVPYVGTVGHWLLTPVFMGGLMIGCDSIQREGTLKVSHLFEGFQGTHFVPLMIIGAVNMALALAIAGITAAGVFGSMKLADIANMPDPLEALAGSWRAMTGMGFLAFVVVLVIGSVFAMLNWFAPALVALRGATAMEAMRLSFFACLRNWVPFLVYGLIFIGVAVAAMLAIGGIALLAGAGAMIKGTSAGIGAFVGFFILLMVLLAIGALALAPIVFGSTYAGYEDTLAEPDSVINPAYQ